MRCSPVSFPLLAIAVVALAPALLAQPAMCWTRKAPPDRQQGHCMATNVNGAGILLLDADTNTWTYDGTIWTQLTLSSNPPPRTEAAMVWDPNRNKVVLFGGTFNGQYRQDTWEWDGAVWTELQPSTRPPARWEHAMAYDFARQRVVLFGGQGTIWYGDTWEWDGTNWVTFAGAGPSARGGHAMASNQVNGVVLFGGDQCCASDQTWVRNGTTWTQWNPAIRPGAERAHAMAFNFNSNDVLLVGGNNANTCWRWNGSAWSPLAPIVQGGSRNSALAMDQQRGVLVAFGGLLNNGPATNNTAVWNGITWTNEVSGPAPRQYAAAAFDPIANRTILHGGAPANSNTPFNDTWAWDGQRWLAQSTPTSFLRFGQSLDWDPVQNRILMFGGWDGGSSTATTFAWNRIANDWTPLAPSASPTPRQFHASTTISAAAGSGVLIFGGEGPGGARNDLWLWNGSTWSSVAATGGPSVRWGSSMAIEPGGNTVLLFGGYSGSLNLGDTWRLNLATQTWTQLFPTTPPSPRRFHRMQLDPSRNRIVLTGGQGAGALQEAWEWNATTSQWQQLAPPPFQRFGHALTRAPGNSLLLFGGAVVGTVFDTTWALTPTAPAQFNPIGSGCGPASGLAPALTCTQLPYIGNVLGLRLQNLPTSGSPFAVLLFDGALLPTPIQVCANCLVQVQASISLAAINTFGTANWQAQLPHLPQLIGASLYVQGATVNAGYPCLPGVGLGLSNAGQLLIGSY